MQLVPEAFADKFLKIKPKTFNKHKAKHKTHISQLFTSVMYKQFDTSRLLRRAVPLCNLSAKKNTPSLPAQGIAGTATGTATKDEEA